MPLPSFGNSTAEEVLNKYLADQSRASNEWWSKDAVQFIDLNDVPEDRRQSSKNMINQYNDLVERFYRYSGEIMELENLTQNTKIQFKITTPFLFELKIGKIDKVTSALITDFRVSNANSDIELASSLDFLSRGVVYGCTRSYGPEPEQRSEKITKAETLAEIKSCAAIISKKEKALQALKHNIG